MPGLLERFRAPGLREGRLQAWERQYPLCDRHQRQPLPVGIRRIHGRRKEIRDELPGGGRQDRGRSRLRPPSAQQEKIRTTMLTFREHATQEDLQAVEEIIRSTGFFYEIE